MAIFVLKDADIFTGPVELSCVANNVSIETSADELDATTFCSDGWKVTQGGMKSWSATVAGFTDYEFESATPTYDTSVDAYSFGSIASSGIFTVAPLGDASTPIYFGTAQTITYTNTGDVGQLAGFNLNATGSSSAGLLQGLALATKDERTGTGSVTAYDYGASISSDAKVYMGLHQLNSTLGTGDYIKVVSSSASNFSGSVDRVEWDADLYTNTTALSSVTGVTHRYWRVEYSLSAPVTFLVVFAIVG